MATHSAPTPGELRRRQRLPAGARDIFGPLLEDLGSLAAQAQRLFSATQAPTADDLLPLNDLLFAILHTHADLVVGSGVVVMPGALADRDRYLHWWWVREQRGPERLRVNLDLSAPDAYDYTRFEWFNAPIDLGGTAMTGPYLDVACTNQYVITVGTPVLVGGRVVAVAAADLPMNRVESKLLPVLKEVGAGVLVNRHSRVVASTLPTILPGSRFPAIDPRPPSPHSIPPWEIFVAPR